MKRVAFITGGTGLLGSWLIRSLLIHGYEKIYVLARKNSKKSSRARVFETLQTHSNGIIIQKMRRSVEVINGDICESRLSLSSRAVSYLLNQTTDIFHTAAMADFRIPLNVIRIPNVKGTRHVFELASLASRNRDLPLHVHHISTVAVAGTLEGWFGEDQFYSGQNFHNPYEQSKFEAEQVAREYKNRGLTVSIYRPGIITGDSRYGITTNFKMIYQPLHFLTLGLFQELPVNEHALHSLVPVDKVADAICLLSDASRQLLNTDGTWQLVNPYEISVGQFISTASRVLHFDKPVLTPLEIFIKKRLSHMQWKLIGPFVPYFNYRLRFRADQTNCTLASLGFKWPKMDDAMLAKLFQYCIRCRFVRPKR